MNTKFKVGDKLKVLDTSNVRSYHAEESIGKTFVLDSVRAASLNQNDRICPFNNDFGCNYKASDFKIFGSKTKKQKPPKFLLQYELDEDPVEYFDSLPQVRKRLKELTKDETLKRHTVRLFELKKELSVDIKETTSITIK